MIKSTLNNIFIGVVFHWLPPDLPHSEVLFRNCVVVNGKLDHHLGKEVDACKAEESPLNSIDHLPFLRSSRRVILFLSFDFILIRGSI